MLRLAQITGLAEMFADDDFSEAWEAEILEDDHEEYEKIKADISPTHEMGGS